MRLEPVDNFFQPQPGVPRTVCNRINTVIAPYLAMPDHVLAGIRRDGALVVKYYPLHPAIDTDWRIEPQHGKLVAKRRRLQYHRGPDGTVYIDRSRW
jgi:hypothetical protein